MGIALEDDILVMEKKTQYCIHLIHLTTKEYWLPKTCS